MFIRLGRLAVRRRRLILALTVLFVVGAGAVGSRVFTSLSEGGFEDPSSESYQARQFLEKELGGGDPDLVLVLDALGGDVDAPAVEAAARGLTTELEADDHVAEVVSYWSLGQAPLLRDKQGDSALVLVDVDGTEEEVNDAAAAIVDDHAGPRGPIDVAVGGRAAVADAIREQVKSDLARAEALAVPATLVLLVMVFGGLVAAALPLAVALLAMIGTFLALFVLAQVTDVSIFSINLTTALGLGLAIDYSLFMISRFREELAAGGSSEAAVVRTMDTAGRTVAFSALTVAASLSALLVFPLYFLRSFAYAGVAVVLLAAAGSLLTLPALLATVGSRVNALSFRRRRQAPAVRDGFWHRLASGVMRRPVAVASGVVAVLVVLGVPFLGVNTGLPSYKALPASDEARRASERLATEFDGNQGEQFSIVLPGVDADGADAAAVTLFLRQVEDTEGVATAKVSTAPGGSWVTVVPDVALRSPDGEALVDRLRAMDAPFGFGVEGAAAELVDSKAAIYSRLPIALAMVGLITFVLLFAVFGSVVVPAKAMVLNLLSLTATFGAMVWVFQDGNLSGILDFTATGQIDLAAPVLMFCIAFGLSMDYEVFLLSRIKEEHDRTGDNTSAVAVGLERTGGIVTAAAGLLAVTFVAFGVTGGVTFLKMFGLGLALAVVMDATVIRGLLVPAFMRLAGEANWWAPAPLRRLHHRMGVGHHVDPVDAETDVHEPTTTRV
jgi:RND superfamily putative drug exporter